MFIIFGSPRSGTTLLSSVLDAHDDIVVPDETDFIVPIAFVFNRVKDASIGKSIIKELIVNSQRFGHSLGEFISNNEIYEIVDTSEYKLGSLLQNLYRYLANKANVKIAGDKSPNDLLYLRVLIEEELFNSDIKVIHIVRDIRDVLVSLREVKWDVDWKTSLDTFFPRFWCDSNLYLHNLMSEDKERYYFVKYEDLIQSPAQHFRQISEFLNVPFQATMLDHTKRDVRYQSYNHHQNIHKPIISDNTNKWIHSLNESSIALCEEQAREALVKFGYALSKG